MAYNNRGIAYGTLDQPQRAIQDFDKAFKLDPTYVYAYYTRGLPRYQLGQYEQAIQDYDEAIGLDPTYVYAYYNRGLAHQLLGNSTEAKRDLQKAKGTRIYSLGYTAKKIAMCRLADLTTRFTLLFSPGDRARLVRRMVRLTFTGFMPRTPAWETRKPRLSCQ